MVELLGENFTPRIKVWFGDVEATTAFRCNTSIICNVPDVSMFRFNASNINYLSNSTNSSNLGAQRHQMPLRHQTQVALNLVRDDGIIYNTGLNFTYTLEPNVGLND